MCLASYARFAATNGLLPLCNTGYTQKNGAVSKVNKKFISHLTRAQPTPPAAATVSVSHALPAVRFSCVLRGRGASFQDGVSARKGFLYRVRPHRRTGDRDNIVTIIQTALYQQQQHHEYCNVIRSNVISVTYKLRNCREVQLWDCLRMI